MNNDVIQREVARWSEEFDTLHLPAVVRPYVNAAPPVLRHTVVFVCMVALSIYSMRLRFRYPFNRTPMGCQLHVYVSADQASGKDSLDEIQAEIMELMSQFNDSEMAREQEYENLPEKVQRKTPRPLTCIFMLPPSTSRTQICKRVYSMNQRFGTGEHVFLYTFSSEIGTLLEANKNAFSDLRTINRLSYDINGKFGLDFVLKEAFRGQVYINQSLLYLGTEYAMDKFFNIDAILNGNLSRSIVLSFRQEIGASAPVYKDIPTCEQVLNHKVLSQLFNEVFDSSNPNALMPEKHLDLSFLFPDVYNYHDIVGTEARRTQSWAIDVFRKRACVSAFRIAAIAYNVYNTENDMLPAAKQLSSAQIVHNTRTIFNFCAYYILNSTLVMYGDIAEDFNNFQRRKRQRSCATSIIDSLMDTFSRNDLEAELKHRNMHTPIKNFIYKWISSGKIEKIGEDEYQKIY